MQPIRGHISAQTCLPLHKLLMAGNAETHGCIRRLQVTTRDRHVGVGLETSTPNRTISYSTLKRTRLLGSTHPINGAGLAWTVNAISLSIKQLLEATSISEIPSGLG